MAVPVDWRQQIDLRQRLYSTLRCKFPSSLQTSLKPINLAAETLESAISTASPSIRSFSLRRAEKLILSHPPNPFSSLLLSLIYGLSRRPLDASLSLLDLFQTDPSSARSEIAPLIFQELFLVHLLPVLQSLNQQRLLILSSSPPNGDDDKDEYSICDESVVISCTKSLSKMSDDQASELKEMESMYEAVVDENCKNLAKYFRQVLENKNGNELMNPPPVMLNKTEKFRMVEYTREQRIGTGEELGFKNGRFYSPNFQRCLDDDTYIQPIWSDGERSVEFLGTSGSRKVKSPPFYPQRVSPYILKNHTSSKRLTTPPNSNSDSEPDFLLDNNSVDSSSSSDSDAETEEKNSKMSLFESRQRRTQKQKQPISGESSCSPDRQMAHYDNPPGGGKHTPPKDFVCPITSNLFHDPVTLETGQTYERVAIQEWLDRGNSTCPITRQKLQNTQLPKTNYVLKRLIASWQEQNPGSAVNHSENPYPVPEQMTKPMVPSTSPNSVISRATIDGTVGELRHAINNLCVSEILKESETAVLHIERFWKEANIEVDIQAMLSKPPVINGFVEILFNSVDPRVLKATVFLLSELGSRDKTVVQTLTRVDSDVECVVALFRKGLMEAVVLIYLLRNSIMNLVEMDLVHSFILVIKKKEEDLLKMCIKPKTAAVLLLGQIFESSEEELVSSIINTLISEKAIESIVASLEAGWAEERIAAIGILLKCMQKEGKCRNNIADKAQIAPVLESFISAGDGDRFKIIFFLSELVKLNRRTFNEQVLHIIKDEGPLSTMHTLLVYLQTALQDQCPVVAGLLLQLDLLAEPRKMSIYREEAIDSLISCLRQTDFPTAQVTAAETIMSLQGRFTISGNSLTRAFLLKRAGLDKTYKSLVRMDQLSNFSAEGKETFLEEEKAADNWERKMASVLVSHEFGLLFEALAEGLKSKHEELSSACFVSATWLVHMFNVLPDTGIRGAARVCLLKHFISVLNSSKDTEEKALSILALRSFIHDPEGMRDLTFYIKDILKGLRELKRSTPLAFEMLKVFSEGQDSSSELWCHKELVQVNCSENGEVLSIVCFKDKIFSGHSDGTIKVWTGKGSILHLIQETREHNKAVTSLAILSAGERLYSGSLDKTTRVWTIGNEAIYCVQVHDMKDQVHNLTVANTVACFIPQGIGVKVHTWKGGSKLLNGNKYVKCLALVHGKLYCGCHDSSIQEIDLATGTLSTIQGGSRKLLMKANPVLALQIHAGQVYAATSTLDGAAVKIFSTSNCSMIGSLTTAMEVRSMAISSELIYLGCKGGTVEIWGREKQNRIDTLQTGTNCKVICMALDSNEEVLVIGTSDGRIQAWGLS
ncbi:hypothetical protein FEM48_Zijuj12G0037400 [Ziziphus jujuba var. spinosa]|uniref:RING-type E3 ubiquitin transferase n=1 Tax=Ziziphus jujuba var. spinosa TaxID=714518 RepID=A0A978UB00_ZIZJJ|nr:hypothetical protein FEM48_Zijuj12G0037400 [Ziziphus jujuba var. spinosa]